VGDRPRGDARISRPASYPPRCTAPGAEPRWGTPVASYVAGPSPDARPLGGLASEDDRSAVASALTGDIRDYKPGARADKPIAPLMIYALALTRLVRGLRLFDIKCASLHERTGRDTPVQIVKTAIFGKNIPHERYRGREQ